MFGLFTFLINYSIKITYLSKLTFGTSINNYLQQKKKEEKKQTKQKKKQQNLLTS